MAQQGQQIVISPTTLAIVLVAGAGAVWLLTRNRSTQQPPAPQSAQTDLDVIKRLQEAEAKRESEWRRRDAIRDLREKQAKNYNDIKLIDSKLNAIDQNNILPVDVIEAVKAEHVQFCQKSWGREGGLWGTGLWDPRKDCNDLHGDDGRWQRRAEELHREQKERLKTTLYAEKGKLQNDKKKIEENLLSFGEPIEIPIFHRVT